MTQHPPAAARAWVQVWHESDVGVVRRRARELARDQGLGTVAAEALALAVTEIARNLVVHAGGGEVLVGPVDEPPRRGVVVIARDTGPGIANLEQAMADGYSTGHGLGLGLPGARRLVDEFEIRSAPGAGTTVTLRQWARPAG